jgi:hypothetical protein
MKEKIKTVTSKNRKVTEKTYECESNESVDGFDTVEDMYERRKLLHEKYIQQRDMPSGPKSIKELLVETDKIIDRFL